MNARLSMTNRSLATETAIEDRALFLAARTQARRWPATGCTVATLAATNGNPTQRARLHISFGLLAPERHLWGARFWEVDALPGSEPVEWLLVSEQPVSCIEDALQLLRARRDLVTRLDCR